MHTLQRHLAHAPGLQQRAAAAPPRAVRPGAPRALPRPLRLHHLHPIGGGRHRSPRSFLPSRMATPLPEEEVPSLSSNTSSEDTTEDSDNVGPPIGPRGRPRAQN